MPRNLHRQVTDGIPQRSLERSGAWSGNKKIFLKTVLSILGGMMIGLIATFIMRLMSRGLNF